MLNVTGQIKVFKLQDYDKYTKSKGVFGIPPQKGKQDAQWENDFINMLFVGKAFDKVAQVNEKEVIYLTGAILRNREYTNRDGDISNWTEIKVFEFLTLEEAEAQGLIKKKNDNQGNQGNGRRGSRGRDQQQDNRSSRGGSRARK